MFQWTVTEGLKRLEADFGAQKSTAEPQNVLKHIKATPQAGDFHPYLDDPVHVWLIKEIAQGYHIVPCTLIMLSHAIDVPAETRHLTTRFTLQMPDRAGIRKLIKEEANRWQSNNRRKVRADHSAVEHLANNLVGITSTDTRRLTRTAIEDDGAITLDDMPGAMESKYQPISQDGATSFEYDTASFATLQD
ncbi:hypothetical protein [Candidatus Vondammii sp. HM_W22]|uniref:hypothetical protein n=1 Tax=Candidatus Vondammii sp. HM_W22 TaxID=2687299 RepID=UPI002A4E1963|nr:hypothetical protein [Candidatus Vondammii sp. HM_W22]